MRHRLDDFLYLGTTDFLWFSVLPPIVGDTSMKYEQWLGRTARGPV